MHLLAPIYTEYHQSKMTTPHPHLKPIIVLGAGIIGLTSAIKLAESFINPIYIVAEKFADDELGGEVGFFLLNRRNAWEGLMLTLEWTMIVIVRLDCGWGASLIFRRG